jgi:AcrR family transcriptional regulator
MVYRATARTEAQRMNTRQCILEAAQRRVLAGGFAAVSMGAVAADAGVATGTLYRHFRNKAELCTELFRTASGREVEVVRRIACGPGGAGERLERVARVFTGRAIRGRHLAWALIAEPLDPVLEQERLDFRRIYADLFRALLDEGMAGEEFAALDSRVAATALVGVMAETLVGPLAPASRPLDASEQRRLTDEICRFCLSAVESNRRVP